MLLGQESTAKVVVKHTAILSKESAMATHNRLIIQFIKDRYKGKRKKLKTKYFKTLFMKCSSFLTIQISKHHL